MILAALFIFLFGFIARYVYLILFRDTSIKGKRSLPVRTVIVIGSGGHTTEMLKLTQELNRTLFTPRIYVMSETDTTSEPKILSAEPDGCNIVRIPRSRHVHQSYQSAVFTTLHSIVKSIPIVFKLYPDLILCNGPGTCFPICAIAFVMKMLWLSDTTIVFVESVCRVKTLSLTGKLMQYLADIILVQWPELEKKYKRTQYIGRLV